MDSSSQAGEGKKKLTKVQTFPVPFFSEDIKENITTHVEIHPSVILGIMANQIAFPENNPLPRDLFSCGQSKQAVSLYHSNYQFLL